MLCGPGLKPVQAHIGTNQNTTEKRSIKIKPVTETKFKIGDLISTPDGGIPMVVIAINHEEKDSTYTLSRDMKDFMELYIDWVENNMVPCEY